MVETINLKYTHIASMAALLNVVSMGIMTQFSSAVSSDIRKAGSRFPNITNNQMTWIASIPSISAVFGNLFSGYMSLRLGRKAVLMYVSVPFLISWLMIAYAPSMSWIYIGRFLSGLCSGVCSVAVPSYVIEIATLEIRGLLGSCYQVSYTIGALIAMSSGIILRWSWLAMTGALFVLSASSLLIFMPESPPWLIANGKKQEALESMCFLKGNNISKLLECEKLGDHIAVPKSVTFRDHIAVQNTTPFQDYAAVYNSITFHTAVPNTIFQNHTDVQNSIYVQDTLTVPNSITFHDLSARLTSTTLHDNIADSPTFQGYSALQNNITYQDGSAIPFHDHGAISTSIRFGDERNYLTFHDHVVPNFPILQNNAVVSNSLTSQDSEDLLNLIPLQDEKAFQNSVTFQDFKEPQLYKPIALAIGLVFFQQFSGVNALMSYIIEIFEHAESSIDPPIAATIVAGVQVLATLLGSAIADKVGRTKLYITSGIFITFGLFILGINGILVKSLYLPPVIHGWIPLIGYIIFVASFSLGFGPIPYLMTPEFVPLHSRSAVLAIAGVFSSLFLFIVTKTFNDLRYFLSDYGVYWVYGSFSILGCFFCWICLPETKGKLISEIQQSFMIPENIK